MSERKSNSSISEPGAWRRVIYLYGLLKLYVRRFRQGDDFTWLHSALDDYRAMLKRHSAKRLESARVLEIGFGARPLRLMALNALRIDATGIDLDKPIIRGTPSEVFAIWRKNGAERAIKSFARFWLNDRRERRKLLEELDDADPSAGMPVEKMIVRSASDKAFWNSLDAKFDLIVSEDVFEHIPRNDLEIVVEEMSKAITPDGLALIRPMIYSGISGGHQLEWYSHTIGRDINRETEPWEHLRQDRHPANTYLNKMLRRDYRELFEKYFDILEETEKEPNLGLELLTPDVRDELLQYPDEELFSNNVMFVLKPRA